MSTPTIETANLGFPRIGLHRELKFALERFWSGEWTAEQLEETAREIRRSNWQMQAAAGIRHIPSNDFSLYDHVLDTAVMNGAFPARYGAHSDQRDLASYFTMARGNQAAPAMEMTKWFDTNYHYIVPEFEPGMEFHTESGKPVGEFQEARAIGITSRPVLLGPSSFVHLGKVRDAQLSRVGLAEALVEPYSRILGDLAAAGAVWVQIDEPCLALDLAPSDLRLFIAIYDKLVAHASGVKILVAAYYTGLSENLSAALRLPVAGLHLDLVRGSEQLSAALAQAPAGLVLSLGVVDGRNVWRTDLDRALELVRRAVDRIGPERIQIAPSCPLLHIPIDLDEEAAIDAEVKPWLAFARQKLEEVNFLAQAAAEDDPAIRERLARNRAILEQRSRSIRVSNPAVRSRVAAVAPEMLRRSSPFTTRRRRQAVITPLPQLPTTTIGSFPQTAEIRRARAARRSGKMGLAEYDTLLCAEIERAIRFQEKTGLDVLVHGEFERSDMVEYFGEQLDGFVFTGNGWVQSYGSRCVKPPVLFGDVSRPKPMTAEWTRYAQSMTKFPVKGMLTGPVTIAEWSFVRDDLPKSEVCFQLALVLRDEVTDLEVAGIRVIQVDEPALREGLPLRVSERAAYLAWAVDAFRLATAGARDETQIHTHMCYAEFGEILDSIVGMNADVISMEAARSRMELLDAFAGREYPNDIGPGVYDIHSPRVPSVEEMEALIRKAMAVFRPEQLWVNPDCGLKTRRWEEVRPALRNMVTAAQRVRGTLASQPIHYGHSGEIGA